ncbi:MAG: DUF58 domain-containing protein [Gammaproteobacteria bacterium]|nr:DUF58 domain-containing protein [Gammaproteobacteria bacterium]
MAWLRSIFSRLRARLRGWARKRQGPDSGDITLNSGRIYILPNTQGIAFGFLLLAMLIGGLNYNNSLGLALAFLLAGLAVVTMHHCHRNLSRLRLRLGATGSAFAGHPAQFSVTLINDARAARFGLTLRQQSTSECIHLEPGEHQALSLTVNTSRRGWQSIDRFTVFSTFPLGLFHCWAWIHPDWRVLVYPRPAPPGLEPPAVETDTAGSADRRHGDADFSGLRNFRDGDSPRHIAWKAFARDESLVVRQYTGADVTTHVFDYDSLDQMTGEARISQLTRWILDADQRGHAYGLRLPEQVIGADLGPIHRERCLRALALL